MITPRTRYQVVSGSLRNKKVFTVSAEESMPGYWHCVYHTTTGSGNRRHEVLLAASQLGPVQEGGQANG